MNKRSTITSIDVGTTKVCTTISELSDTMGVRIVGVGVTPSHGLHKGLVVNINDARESIRESVSKAEQTSGYRVESAYIGVTGRHVSSLNNRGRTRRADNTRNRFSFASAPNTRARSFASFPVTFHAVSVSMCFMRGSQQLRRVYNSFICIS